MILEEVLADKIFDYLKKDMSRQGKRMIESVQRQKIVLELEDLLRFSYLRRSQELTLSLYIT